MSEKRIKVRWSNVTAWTATFDPAEAAAQFGSPEPQAIALRAAASPDTLAELEADTAEGTGFTGQIQVTAAEAVLLEDGLVWLYQAGDPPGQRQGPFPTYEAALNYWSEHDQQDAGVSSS